MYGGISINKADIASNGHRFPPGPLLPRLAEPLRIQGKSHFRHEQPTITKVSSFFPLLCLLPPSYLY